MKIKRRTEVTIVTHEITLLRHQDGEAQGDTVAERLTTYLQEPSSSDDSLYEVNEEEGKEYETEKNDS